MNYQFDPNANLNLPSNSLLTMEVSQLPEILEGVSDYRPFVDLIENYVVSKKSKMLTFIPQIN